jgi:hypothetical protein
MTTNFTNSFLTGTRDYSKDLAAMKRTAAKADKDPAFALKLLASNPMHTKTGKLKKQFR